MCDRQNLNLTKIVIIESVHEISNNVACATSKASDQPAHTRSLINAFVSISVKLLTEHHLRFLSLKEGCRGSSKSTIVKISNYLKSLAAVRIQMYK